MKLWQTITFGFVFLIGNGPVLAAESTVFFPPSNIEECRSGSVMTWKYGEEAVRCVQILDLIKAACNSACTASINLMGGTPSITCTPPKPECLKYEDVTYKAYEVCGEFDMITGEKRILCVHNAPFQINGTTQVSTIYDIGEVATGTAEKIFTDQKCVEFSTFDCSP